MSAIPVAHILDSRLECDFNTQCKSTEVDRNRPHFREHHPTPSTRWMGWDGVLTSLTADCNVTGLTDRSRLPNTQIGLFSFKEMNQFSTGGGNKKNTMFAIEALIILNQKLVNTKSGSQKHPNSTLML